MRKYFVSILLLTLVQSAISSQHLTHEIGLHAGSAMVQGDYQNNYDLNSITRVSGISVSLTHTVHFFNRNLRWNANHFLWVHIALRSELNIVSGISLEHQGRYVTQNSEQGIKLRAMRGSLNLISFGLQLEYFVRPLGDYPHHSSNIKLNPYFLAGIHYNMYNNNLTSSLGDWQQDISVIPDKWQAPGALDIGPGSALSATLGFGTRYKFSDDLDLNFQLSSKYFFSDSVDGLNAPSTENRFNDFLANTQFGIIYHLNLSRPLRLF